MKKKNVYITWHYTTHGIAYLKHILSAFYIGQKENLKQEELNEVFDKSQRKGVLFDEIIYLTAPQETFDKISSRRSETKECICDITKETWDYIHYHTIKEQIEWLTKHSNFQKVYKPGIFKEKELDITDLRNEEEIAKKVVEWARTYFKQENKYTIDVSLGTSETQVVWYVLAEKGILPRNVQLIKTYDNKMETKRFKSFSIKDTPTNLIQSININLFEKTISKSRKLANEKMKSFIESGFSILLIGERGTGKSKLAKDNTGKSIISANCASFADDTMAESQLFGHKRGAFTGAHKDTPGLFQKANGGILFLDEIHHLTRCVQAKLMLALQTDENNKMHICKLGENNEEEVKFKLIVATNKTIKELREILLPDFYDRIVQNVIEIPSLRETAEDREDDWKRIWGQMKFTAKYDPPCEQELISWLKELPLYGNFRDLQKIAIYYDNFKSNFSEELKNMIPKKTPFEYAKHEFETWNSSPQEQLEDSIYIKLTPQRKASEILKDFKVQLRKRTIERCGNRKKAAKELKVSVRTLNNW